MDFLSKSQFTPMYPLSEMAEERFLPQKAKAIAVYWTAVVHCHEHLRSVTTQTLDTDSTIVLLGGKEMGKAGVWRAEGGESQSHLS